MAAADPAAPVTPRPAPGNRAAAPGFGSGDRHGWLDALCEHLQAAIWAAAGRRPAHRPGPLADPGRRAALPCWRWAEPAADVGRKARAADGGTLLLPVRIHWQPGPLLLVPRGQPVRAAWRAAGLGLDGDGAAGLACTPHPGGTARPGHRPAGTGDRAGGVPGAIAEELAGFAAAGRPARWDLLAMLEPYVRSAVTRAHSRVAIEVAGPAAHSRPSVLDDTDLDAVVDMLLLGGDTGGPGPVARLLDRCLRPDTFRRVDPLRYIAVTLRRDAEQEIRRRIGDPRIGPKIRALHRQHPALPLPDLVAAYREQHPRDRLSMGRAVAALETRLRVRVPVDDAVRAAGRRGFTGWPNG